MGRSNRITITYADGRQEIVAPGKFRKPRSKTARLAAARRTPHWREIRRLALERDGHKCDRCGGDEKLEVHHRTYVRVGNERLADVETLCQRCHSVEHQWRRREARARRTP